ncbi:MAP kinase kinase kinase kinase activity protein [Tritrichomonas musculus]|uniref:non-specific serine/threonine protein kinase n=1 Tax=Tritrichomonas musculus TaxID=1915356 RepID=A0ABR2GNM3_9EUKA
MKTISLTDAEKRFKNIFEIGSGGFGHVEKAYDKEKKELIAIKIISNFESSEQTKREISFLQKCKHENIVGFNEAFAVNNDLWISMEYCSFGSIAKYKSLMNEKFVLCIIRDVLSALSYLHSQEMIHSDVKPQNILFSNTCDIKLADFGIAHNLNSISVQQTGKKDGTPFYMAPEMINGRPISSSIDIWALGITAFEMIVGIPLGLTGYSNIQEWIESNNPKWSYDFKDILNKMLENDPLRRPSAKLILQSKIFQTLKPTWMFASEILHQNYVNSIFDSDDD